MKYLIQSNGQYSGTKTMLVVGGLLVMVRWFIGGITITDPETQVVTHSVTAISGLDAAALLAAFGINRKISSQHTGKPEENQ